MVARVGDRAVLKVDGSQTDLWTDIQFTRSILDAGQGFAFTLVSQTASDVFPADEGAPVSLEVIGPDGATEVIMESGWLESYSDRDDDNVFEQFFRGRNEAYVAIDFDVFQENSSRKFKSLSAFQIAQQLVTQVDLTVELGMELTLGGRERMNASVRGFKVKRGESIGSALSRLAEQAAVLLTTRDNVVVFTEGAMSRSLGPLYAGPIARLSASMSNDATGRGSVLVTSQRSRNLDLASNETDRSFALSVDPIWPAGYIRFQRSSRRGTTQDYEALAAWQRNKMVGEGRRYQCTVPGWRDAEGRLFDANTVYTVRDGRRNLGEDMVLSEVLFQQTADTQTASLVFISGDSLRSLIDPTEKRTRSGRRFGPEELRARAEGIQRMNELNLGQASPQQGRRRH